MALALRASETGPASPESTAAAIERLTALVEAQARTISDYQATLAHSRYIFEQASAAARLGVWECDLISETLTWSDGTYDLFDVPRGTPLIRERTLGFYEYDSLTTLQAVRSRAIRDRKGFSLDAAIVTPRGKQRWIRIHATVEGAGDRPTSIFGIKQDITEEKTQLERIRYFAEFDDMTGLANRNKFQTQLSLLCSGAPRPQAGGALLLIDLDGFKDVNDTLGHMAGDECLRETAHRLRAICDKASLVARIGGDEFAILLEPPTTPARRNWPRASLPCSTSPSTATAGAMISEPPSASPPSMVVWRKKPSGAPMPRSMPPRPAAARPSASSARPAHRSDANIKRPRNAGPFHLQRASGS